MIVVIAAAVDCGPAVPAGMAKDQQRHHRRSSFLGHVWAECRLPVGYSA